MECRKFPEENEGECRSRELQRGEKDPSIHDLPEGLLGAEFRVFP